MHSAISTVAATVVATYAFLGVLVTFRAISAASGVFASDYLVAHAVTQRLRALTGKEVDEFLRQKRPLKCENLQSLRSARRMQHRHGNSATRMSTYRLLPFCADYSDMVSAFNREVAQAEYRGSLHAHPFLKKIRETTTLDGLASCYASYRRWNRRAIIHSTFGPKRLARGRAPYSVIYWRKLFSYTGRGGGVGVLLSYLAAGSIVADVPFTVIGGVVALFAFLVKVVVIWGHSYRFTWCKSAVRMNDFAIRRPVITALIVTAILITLTASIRLAL
ncbi:Uncharacterised protein [Mycobacteroides abscessus subsp. massiliense]|nr:Uncharacterised protein [Mycobacteroides abscessus subsp. massiliense]SKH56406.1 Uncharacterised protein [Mycobacteroides abscessus subsp. massiliense]SKI08424.1 Uncharacterised protein [Mycobacteroides abscessus subsp. massiliense]SKJ39532.1 Uncharacterised protein [Mycobacteroides abscessus subsp. massiliense]SKJ82905.1 Uncharacterised protein [Mycobacteroides abscessus subsp. massiliense]